MGFISTIIPLYTASRGANWQTRPITGLSFALNAAISSRPFLWHLVSIAVHFCTVVVLYELLLRMVPAQAALLGAAVFAVHPIQAEAVAYVFARATLFSTMLAAASMLAWLKGHRWAAVVMFGAALVCKEDCATVPLLILLLERARWRSKILPLSVMMLLSLAAAVHSLWVTQNVPGSGAGFTAGLSSAQYVVLQGYVVLRYLQMVILPWGFTVDPEIHISVVGEALSWAVLFAIAIWAARKSRFVLAGLLLLLPTCSVFPLADAAADHRMYLPMTAFAAACGAWLARLPRWGAVIALLLLIGVSAQRMQVWSSDERLWTEAMKRAPGKLRPRIQLSRAVEPRRAEPILREAQGLHPESLDVQTELGRVYLDLGRPELALSEFGAVLGRAPRDPHAMNNRGVALRALGQTDAAKQDFERALGLDRCLPEARRNLDLPPCQ